jgi:hypothetical protein
VVKLVAPLHQISDHANKVTPHGATNAAVVHFDNLLVGINDELPVDSHLPEFVYNDGDSFPVLRRQNAIEQGRFARSQKAGDYRNRDCRYSS